MKYAKIEDSIVTQVQPDYEDGFVEVDDCVCCGMEQDGDSYVIPDKTLEQLQTSKKAEVDEEYDSLINAGFEYNDNTYHCDDTTLSIIGSRLSHCNSTTNLGDAELVFYNSDKESVTFEDKASIVTFFEAFITSRNALDQNKLDLKYAIESATTEEELEEIDVTQGW